MQDVDGKVAFITGGSSGIGLGIALAFARAGMRVVVAGRRPQHLDSSAALFAAEGLDVHGMLLDVTDQGAVERAAAETERRFGRVHVLVNNAGINSSAIGSSPALRSIPSAAARDGQDLRDTPYAGVSSSTISGSGPARSSGAAGV